MTDFPGGPVIKTSPSNSEGVGSIPGQGAKIPHSSWPRKKKTYNRSNTVTNSIKTFLMVNVKKIFKKKKKTRQAWPHTTILPDPLKKAI